MVDVVKSAFGKIHKKFNKGYEHYLSIYLIINVIWLYVGLIFYSYFRFSYQNYSISLIFLMSINILFSIVLLFLERIKFNLIDVFLILLVLFGIISTALSKDVSVSLYGYWRRYEGFLQLLYYYSLMYLGTAVFKDKCKKFIIYSIFVFGIVNVLICFMQVYNIFKFVNVGLRDRMFGMGLLLNTNFAGSYMVLCLGLSLGLFLYSKNRNCIGFIIKLVLCLLFFSGLLMSNAMSGVVGLFFICLLIVMYFIYMCVKKSNSKENIIKHLVLLVSCFLVFISLSYTRGTIIGRDFMLFSRETSELVKGNTNDNFGSGRIFVWKNTLKVVPKYILHGVGVDNFCNAFEYPLSFEFSPGNVVYYDKVHNEYLQKLVCEGIFSCITYIVMLAFIFFKSVKENVKKFNYISVAFLFAFSGYCVQAFFNISVIEVAPLFWIVCGLLYDRRKKSDMVV